MTMTNPTPATRSRRVAVGGPDRNPSGLATADAATPTVEALDYALDEIQRLKATAGLSLWNLGAKIKDIFDQQLWKARNGDDGRPRYRSFDAFVREELKVSKSSAYRLKEIAGAYSAEQVERFGASKLGIVLEVPPEHRPALLQAVAEGESARTLQRKASAIKSGAKPARRIGIANVIGVKKGISLYARPARKGDPPVRATSVKDQPYGYVDLDGSLRLYVVVDVDAEGQLRVVAQFKPPPAAGKASAT